MLLCAVCGDVSGVCVASQLLHQWRMVPCPRLRSTGGVLLRCGDLCPVDTHTDRSLPPLTSSTAAHFLIFLILIHHSGVFGASSFKTPDK